MRDIVINTGPIIALVAGVTSIEWLPALYNRILIPFEVYKELEAGGWDNPEIRALDAVKDSLEITNENIFIPTDLIRELDTGEASVIQTAKIHEIDAVAIDEKAGRRVARIHGLKVTGSLGILLKAQREGMVKNIPGCITLMRSRGIWISTELEAEFIRRTNAG